MLIASGVFVPGQGHELIGSFTLTKQTNGILMLTSEDFFFDGSPAPGWALFNGVPMDAQSPVVKSAAAQTDFQRLTDKVEPISGRQTGLIPHTIDFEAYDTLFLWCFEIPFILGYGRIEKV